MSTSNIVRQTAPLPDRRSKVGQRGASSSGIAQKSVRQRRLFYEAIAFSAPVIIYLVAFFGYPIFQNLLMSFQDYSNKTFVTGAAPWVGLENYREMLGSRIFLPALRNTLLFTVGSICGQFVIGMALAMFLTKRFRGNSFLRSLMLLPWLLPLIVSSAAWRSIMDQDGGVLNAFLSSVGIDGVPWLTSPSVALVAVTIVNVWIGIPFNATILYSGLKDIPTEQYEAAELDGATGWKTFWYITLPNLKNVIGVVLILGVVYTIKALDIILGLTNGGPGNATQTLSVQAYQQSFIGYKFGVGASYSTVLLLISLAFALVYLRMNRKAADE